MPMFREIKGNFERRAQTSASAPASRGNLIYSIGGHVAFLFPARCPR
jgi:hypothetical protein